MDAGTRKTISRLGVVGIAMVATLVALVYVQSFRISQAASAAKTAAAEQLLTLAAAAAVHPTASVTPSASATATETPTQPATATDTATFTSVPPTLTHRPKENNPGQGGGCGPNGCGP